MTILARIKSFLKTIVYRSLFLRRIFVWLYKAGGRRPWSLGYSVYKFGYIRDVAEHRIAGFRGSNLRDHYGARLDERVVEYPWVFSRLKSDARIILDAGSSLNHSDILSLSLWQGRRLTISTLAFEGVAPSTVHPTYVYEDMRAMSFAADAFDAVICLSSLEHVGMDNTFLYASDPGLKENDKYAYLKAVQELRRVLKIGGHLYLTVPYGRYQNHGWFQVFDAEMIMKAKEAFAPSGLTEAYFKYEHEQWNCSDAESCREGSYFDIHKEKRFRHDYLAASECVACLEMKK